MIVTYASHAARCTAQTKLTLRLEDKVIEPAKRHAEKRGKTVSQMVSVYISLLDREGDVQEDALPPITRSLSGVLEGTETKREDYYLYLEEKHR